jgi:hypothetical protein
LQVPFSGEEENKEIEVNYISYSNNIDDYNIISPCLSIPQSTRLLESSLFITNDSVFPQASSSSPSFSFESVASSRKTHSASPTMPHEKNNPSPQSLSSRALGYNDELLLVVKAEINVEHQDNKLNKNYYKKMCCVVL